MITVARALATFTLSQCAERCRAGARRVFAIIGELPLVNCGRYRELSSTVLPTWLSLSLTLASKHHYRRLVLSRELSDACTAKQYTENEAAADSRCVTIGNQFRCTRIVCSASDAPLLQRASLVRRVAASGFESLASGC